jgi:DNA-binding transcriptional LysR family regulator
MREANSGTRRVFEQFICSYGYDISMLNVVMELGSTQAVKEAVKAGFGIAAVSRLAVVEEIKREQVSVVSLTEGPIERGFALLHNKEKFQTKAVDKFISYFIEKVRLYPGRKILQGKGICKNG